MKQLLWVLGALVLTGCSGESLVEVHGKVTYDGKPVESGTINFEPEDRSGPSQGVAITNGEYRFAGPNRIEPGAKLVRIHAFGPSGKKTSAAPGSSTMVDAMHQYIPSRYNTASELKCNVEPGKEMLHNIDLTK